MTAQKTQQKNSWQKFFAFSKAYYKKTTLLILQDHIEDYQKIKSTGSSRELFLPENDFQTSSTVNFPFRISRPTKEMKLRLEYFFTCSSTYELNIMKKWVWALNRYIFKGPQVLRPKLKKKRTAEKVRKLSYTIFLSFISGSNNPRK